MLISVVIPTYNREGHVIRALDSALSQTDREFEVIVVDDGSEDRTGERLTSYGNRILYLRQEHRGVSAARNLGIRRSRGEWIAFLDSDDIWEPNALESLRQASREFPRAGLIAMRARLLRPDGSIDDRVRGKKSPGPYFTTATLLGEDTAGVLTPMVLRTLLQEEGGFDESLFSAEDCDLWIRLSFRTTMVAIPQALLRRRMHAGNLTANRGLNALMWLRVLDKLARDHPEFVRQHSSVVRRAQGKEHLRLGRELLKQSKSEPGMLVEARTHLRRSVRSYPYFLRAYRYLLASYLSRAPVGPSVGES